MDNKARLNVRRMLVVAAVPVFVKGINVTRARDAIIAGLETAVSSGKFVELAEG